MINKKKTKGVKESMKDVKEADEIVKRLYGGHLVCNFHNEMKKNSFETEIRCEDLTIGSSEDGETLSIGFRNGTFDLFIAKRSPFVSEQRKEHIKELREINRFLRAETKWRIYWYETDSVNQKGCFCLLSPETAKKAEDAFEEIQ